MACDGKCCFHEQERQSFRAGNNSYGTMTKTERCCFCGDYRCLSFTLQRSPEHGQYGPSMWTPDQRTKDKLEGKTDV